jgi:hypothetical protein
MAGLKVSDFDPADPLTGDETFGFVQNTENRQASLSDLVTYFNANSNAIQEWAPNWNVDLDLYIPAVAAMTVSQGNPPIGVGDITFQKSTAADPGTFADTVLPVDLEAGAWLKLSATGVDVFLATHLVRTA